MATKQMQRETFGVQDLFHMILGAWVQDSTLKSENTELHILKTELLGMQTKQQQKPISQMLEDSKIKCRP